MAHKFVINNGYLILGDVEIHEQLVKGMDKSKTIGGGRWHFDKAINTIYFYGKSIDFGKVTKEQFETALKSQSLQRHTIVFSDKEYFKDVEKEQETKKE